MQRANAVAEANRATLAGAPPQWCEELGEGGSGNLWQRCCNVFGFDILGNEECFRKWPSWEVSICCGLLEDSAAAIENMTRKLAVLPARGRPPQEQPWMDRPSTHDSFIPKAIVAYHKTGTQLMEGLLTVPGILSSALGMGSDNTRSGLASGIRTNSNVQGEHWQRATRNPFYLGWVHFKATPEEHALQSQLFWCVNPLRLGFFSTLDALAEDQGLLVHLVRRPSDVVVSGYSYHRRSKEGWEDLRNPPSCLNCDHHAWLKIFRRCSFKCSYADVLRNTSVSEGLGAEVLRSRWQLLSMLERMRKWQDRPRVLQLSLTQFVYHFEASLRCVARFLLQIPPPAPIPRELLNLEELLASSRQYPLDLKGYVRRCSADRSACAEEQMQGILKHVSPDREKVFLRSELQRRTADWADFLEPMDAAFDSVLQHDPFPSLYGCPP